MEIEEQKYNRAFSILIRSLNELDSNDILIGRYTREIKKLEKKNEVDLRNALVAAANYFTKERITELHTKSVELLKCDDFDVDEYCSRFSDIATIKLEDILFLVKRQKDIDDFEADLNEIDSMPNKKTMWSKLADAFRRDGANDDN